jgi:hypothetical protein
MQEYKHNTNVFHFHFVFAHIATDSVGITRIKFIL